jgi:hypothetical protein
MAAVISLFPVQNIQLPPLIKDTTLSRLVANRTCPGGTRYANTFITVQGKPCRCNPGHVSASWAITSRTTAETMVAKDKQPYQSHSTAHPASVQPRYPSHPPYRSKRSLLTPCKTDMFSPQLRQAPARATQWCNRQQP